MLIYRYSLYYLLANILLIPVIPNIIICYTVHNYLQHYIFAWTHNIERSLEAVNWLNSFHIISFIIFPKNMTPIHLIAGEILLNMVLIQTIVLGILDSVIKRVQVQANNILYATIFLNSYHVMQFHSRIWNIVVQSIKDSLY